MTAAMRPFEMITVIAKSISSPSLLVRPAVQAFVVTLYSVSDMSLLFDCEPYPRLAMEGNTHPCG